MLPISAWLILFLASFILFGGLVLCLRAAIRNGRMPAKIETARDINRGLDNH